MVWDSSTHYVYVVHLQVRMLASIDVNNIFFIELYAKWIFCGTKKESYPTRLTHISKPLFISIIESRRKILLCKAIEVFK